MSRQVKSNKKIISLFLIIGILYSIVFTGIKVSAATTGGGASNNYVPNIKATLNSANPNPARSSDQITVNYNINTDPFTLSNSMINEAVVLVDMSQDMKNNQRFSEIQNGFVNSVINDSNLSNIKLGVVGYNDSVYIGTRSNYSDPKSCVMIKTDENLSNIDAKFLPVSLYNLNDGNTKDGYRQFYQSGYIYNNISDNTQRQFGSALKAADNLLSYGTSGAKKAIIIVSSGNFTYTDDQLQSVINKGYKIITLDISNSSSTNIQNTHMKLCGIGNYYKGTFNDSANYNSVDNDMKNVALSLEGNRNPDTVSIRNAKLNIDLGENFEAVDGTGLNGVGKVRNVTIPQINYQYNSINRLWQQSGQITVSFKVKPVSNKYGQLSFGMYTNSDRSITMKTSTISYTGFDFMSASNTIDTPIITINKPAAPTITSPQDRTATNNNKPPIIGTAEVNSTVKVYDGTILIGTVIADANRNWTLTPTIALSDGAHVISATETDVAGNVSEQSNIVNITIDTTAPSVPTITSPQDRTVTNNNKPPIIGIAEANSTVKVYDGTTLIGTVTTNANGNWTLTPTVALPDGAHAISATATDGAGNVSGQSNIVNITIDTTAPSVPTITAPPNGTVTNNNKPQITGTAEANSIVNVYDGTTLIGTVTTDANGNWTLTPTVALPDGTNPISATATDAAGNVSEQSDIVNITINKIKATMNLKKELPIDAFIGNEFEIKYTIIPNDISVVNSNDSNPKELVVSNLAFNEVLPEGLNLDQSKIDSSKLDIILNGNNLSANIVPTIIYTLDSTKTKYTAQPISFSIWVSSNVINTYNMSGQNSYITYDDIDNTPQKSNFNDLQIIVNGYSNILKHGIFNGNFNNISIKEGESGLSITKSIPVTLAMMVDINSINPIINLNISDSTKISESNITFKKYEISTDGSINKNSIQQLTLSTNRGSIKLNNDGFKMEPNKRYIIIYTITPKGDVDSNININSNIVGIDKVKNVGLTIKDLPDLF